MVRLALTAAFIYAILTPSAFSAPTTSLPFVTASLKRYTPENVTAHSMVAHARSRREAMSGLGMVHSRATSGSITNKDNMYTVGVQVGVQTFALQIDTGSSFTWVGGGATKFSAGSTGVATGQTFSILYGDGGTVQGNVYTDLVSVFGLIASGQRIGAVTTSTGQNGKVGLDGVLGLGPVAQVADYKVVANGATVPTFMNTLANQGTIATQVFGVYFKPLVGSDSVETNGELTLGGVDASKYKGSLTYSPRTSNDFWQLAVSAITWNGASMGTNFQAVVDTGTTLISLPHSAITSIIAASTAGAIIDSSTGLLHFASKPTAPLGFAISGVSMALTPDQFLIPTAQLPVFGLSTNSGYYAWITDGGTSGTNFIIGQKWLEYYYAVFDATASNIRIGLAPRV